MDFRLGLDAQAWILFQSEQCPRQRLYYMSQTSVFLGPNPIPRQDGASATSPILHLYVLGPKNDGFTPTERYGSVWIILQFQGLNIKKK